MLKSIVSIVKGMDAGKMVEEALSLLGGVSSLIKPGSSVVIKPNAIGGQPPERGANTSPAVVSAVIKELRKAQPKEIIMAESAGGMADSMESMERCGQKKAAEEAGIDHIIDIKKDTDLIGCRYGTISLISSFSTCPDSSSRPTISLICLSSKRTSAWSSPAP